MSAAAGGGERTSPARVVHGPPVPVGKERNQSGPSRAGEVVLWAEDVRVDYMGDAPTHAVRGVSFTLRRGEILGVAGESGCGKSTLAYAVTRLLRPPARLVGGTVRYWDTPRGEFVDIMRMTPEQLRRWRWEKVSMVFQSAMNALNPVTSLRRQFGDVLRAHIDGISSDEVEARGRRLLEMVGIDPARIASFPHELSGGMRQRVGIAMALALRPEVVVLDEPTTALDVVVQREILNEVRRLQAELGFSVIFITHDLSLLLEICDRLVVMYGGEVAELGPAARIAGGAAHPYTRGLLRSTPTLFGDRKELAGIPGSPPDLRKPVKGCAFAPRCPHAFDLCLQERPVLAPPVAAGAQEAAMAPELADRAPIGTGAGTAAGTAVGPGPDGRPGTRAEWEAACHLRGAVTGPVAAPAAGAQGGGP